MSKTLEEIRRKLQALGTGSSSRSLGGDKSIYPHWNIPEGTSSIQRFLPDANEDNTFFWTERQVIKIPFSGIVGQDEHKQVIVQVPCIEMYDGPKTCPILNEVRPMWKDASLEDTARRYWVKRSYYMQGFLKQDPLKETEPPENPIRKYIIGPQIFAIIKAALMDPDMEHSPVDYINGTDFIISKTSKGGYADYGTSKWARKESSITEEMQEAIDTYGLVDLSTYLPKRPTPEQLAAMFEMFQASLDGELYDPARWGQYYKPYGYDSSSDDNDVDSNEDRKATRSRPVSVPVAPVAKQPSVQSAETDDDDGPPFDVDPPAEVKKEVTATPTTGKSPQEILQMLRNRNK